MRIEVNRNKESFKKKMQWIRIGSFGVSVMLLIAGYVSQSFNVLACCLMVFLFHNIIFAAENIKERFLFLIMHIMIFTFLISRPFLGMCRGEEWWTTAGQSAANIHFAINSILLSMSALIVGAKCGEYLGNKTLIPKKKEVLKYSSLRMNLQVVSMVVFYITMCFFLLQEAEKLFYMQGKTYLEFYTSFHGELPWFFYTIASFMKYSLCIFLATMPSKKRAFVPLAFFEISAIPQLIIGVRNPIMLNSLFIFLYYVIRDIRGDYKKWIGKIEKILLAIGIPFALIFASVYDYLRSGLEVAQHNVFRLFTDFFYGQGVTFNVLAIAFGHRRNLPERPWRNYTFGGMIDYIVHGKLGQILWGTEPLPTTNCWTNGRISNSLSHNLSYLTKKEEYLNGQGWGSSYLLESYIDFGYIGLVLFSLILGILLVYMLKRFGRNTLLDTIFLMSLTTIFFIPRAEATGWLTFIITLQFWICAGCCYLGAFICTKCVWIQKILKFLHLYPKECQVENS